MKKFITLAAVAAVVLAACSKEQTEVKIIKPNGMVLLSIPEQIVAGDSAAIRLRVNPSTARLTADNLSIDCLESMVYDAEYSDVEQKYLGLATKSRAAAEEESAIPYVQNTDNYSICSVVPDSLDHKPLEGQYIVIVKAQDTKNIIDRSTLALVCRFEDENCDTAYISTGTFSLPQIPRPGDAIFAWSPQSISLHAGSLKPTKDSVVVTNDTINCSKWYLSVRNYKNAASGATIRYDYSKHISDVKVRLYNGSDEIACNQIKTDFGGVYSSIDEMYAGFPDVAQEPFKTLFESGSDKKYETYTNTLTVTDKYGHADRWSQDLNVVVPVVISFKLDVPEDVTTGKYNVVDKEATFAEYGIDIETIKRYPGLNLVALSASNMGGTGISFAGRTREDSFGLAGVTVAAGSKSIKADLLCSRVFGMFYVKGPGPTTSGPLVNDINFIERFVPAK